VCSELPLTAETFLKTKQTQNVHCISMSGGDYIHLGFHEALCELLKGCHNIVELQLALNVDGVPLFA